MSRIFFSILIAISIALPVRAEIFKDSEIQVLTPQISAACMKQANKPGWLKPGDDIALCNCVGDKVSAKLRQTNFSNTKQLSEADKQLYVDIEAAAGFECLQPIFKVMIEKQTTKQCHDYAPKVRSLKGLSAANLDTACSCTATHFAMSYDLKLVQQTPDAQALAKRSGELFMQSIAQCTKK